MKIPTSKSMDSKQAKLKLKAELSAFSGTRKQWYWDVYLRSEHWKGLRAQALHQYGHRCAKCPATRFLDVHHLKYRSVYDVTVADLQLLCRPCHELEHALTVEPKAPKKKRRSKRTTQNTGLPPLDEDIYALISEKTFKNHCQKNCFINKLMKRLRMENRMTPDLRLRLMSEKTGAKARAAKALLLKGSAVSRKTT